MAIPAFGTPATRMDPPGRPELTPAALPPHVERLQHGFEQACDRHPDAIALVCGPAQLTYAELDQRANRLAHLLQAHGVAAGTPVGIFLPRSVELYVALLGVLKT